MKIRFNWGTGIFVFLTIFVGLAVTFIVFAMSQKVDLVTDDYYEQGADYTAQMNVNKRSARFKNSFVISNEENNVMIGFHADESIDFDTLQVHFYRPSDEGKDYLFTVSENRFPLVVEKEKLFKGRYIVRIKWRNGVDDYLVSKEFMVE